MVCNNIVSSIIYTCVKIVCTPLADVSKLLKRKGRCRPDHKVEMSLITENLPSGVISFFIT